MKRPKYKVQLLPLAKILPNPSQRPIDEAGVKLLMHSIRNEGVNEPLVVVASGDDDWDDDFWIVKSGGHRHLACVRLKLKMVPCIVVDKNRADSRAVTDNLVKARYSKLEEAKDLVEYARKHMKDAPAIGGVQPNDKGISKVSKALGQPRKKVSRAYGIAGLQESIQKLLQDKKLDNNVGLLHELIALDSEKARRARILSRTKRLKAANSLGERHQSIPHLNSKKQGTLPLKKKEKDEDGMVTVNGIFLSWKKSEASKLLEEAGNDTKIAFIRRVFSAKLVKRAAEIDA